MQIPRLRMAGPLREITRLHMTTTPTLTQFLVKRNGYYLQAFTAWSVTWTPDFTTALRFDAENINRVLERFEGSEKEEYEQ